jgi:hypothetical protein
MLTGLNVSFWVNFLVPTWRRGGGDLVITCGEQGAFSKPTCVVITGGTFEHSKFGRNGPFKGGWKVRNDKSTFKRAVSYSPFPLAQIGFHFCTPSHGSEWPSSFQADYITEPIPQPTHFNPADGGSVFLWSVGICLQNYTVLQFGRPKSVQSPLWKPQNLN